MRRFTLVICMSILLLLVAAPVTALTSQTIASDSIGTVSPTAIQKGETVEVTINGVNFTGTQGTVRLEKSGENDIEPQSITSWSVSQIKCKFKAGSTREIGKWNVVVVKGFDSTTIVGVDKIALTDKLSLTSIEPKTGPANDDLDFTLKGKNFDDDIINKVYLYKKGNENITDSNVDVKSETELKGTFELDGAEEDDYDVCIEDKNGIVECDLSFEVTSGEVGELSVSSSPSGAAVSLDGVNKGNTPLTIEDIVVGSHKVVLTKAGYQEWGKTVRIDADEEEEIDATLYAVPTATQSAAPTPPPPTATPRTTRTTIKSSIAIPTTWVDTPTTTAASPVDPLLIIGALGLGFIALRKP